ncbi:hypothetical protein [Streptomyces sp. NPDC057301]|uniref:hypothetical protein n=1 Tax=Streptomyces sp. NPDC057301 TaxID=3346093 RepID=UPI00362DDB4E
MGIGELPPNAPPGTARVSTGRTVRQVIAQVARDFGTTELPCLEIEQIFNGAEGDALSTP